MVKVTRSFRIRAADLDSFAARYKGRPSPPVVNPDGSLWRPPQHLLCRSVTVLRALGDYVVVEALYE